MSTPFSVCTGVIGVLVLLGGQGIFYGAVAGIDMVHVLEQVARATGTVSA
jgi:hypothetical protein